MVELPEVEMAPVALLIAMLLKVMEGDVDLHYIRHLDLRHGQAGADDGCSAGGDVMFRLPVAVNNVLLPVPTVNVRSVAPV